LKVKCKYKTDVNLTCGKIYKVVKHTPSFIDADGYLHDATVDAVDDTGNLETFHMFRFAPVPEYDDE